MAPEVIAQIIEAALLAAEGPLTVDNLFRLFSVGELDEEEGRKQIRTALETLQEACHDRGVTLQKECHLGIATKRVKTSVLG